MRFLETNQIREWCEERGIPLDRDARPAPDPRLAHAERTRYADGERSGREPSVAAAAVRALGSWDECLLWVTLWGVWANLEDWPAYYAARGRNGERRALDVAPGHWFEAGERDALVKFLTLVMENGWDAYVLPALAGRRAGRRLVVSHDEWVELQSDVPLELDVPAGKRDDLLPAERWPLAALAAPPVGVLVAWLGFLATGAVVLRAGMRLADWAGAAWHWLGFFCLLGLPLAYAVEAVALRTFGAPRVPQLQRPAVTVSVAALLGGLLMAGVWGGLLGLRFGLMLLPAGVLAGAAAGVVFGAFFPRST